MRSWNNPHKVLQKKWDSFNSSLMTLRKILEETSYNPKINEVNDSYAYPYKTWHDETELGINSKIFLLPIEYKLLGLNELLEPLPVPEFPTIPVPPEIQYEDKNAYESWYLSKSKDTFWFDMEEWAKKAKGLLSKENCEKRIISSLDRDVVSRNLLLDELVDLTQKISEKWKKFQDEFVWELSTLNQIRDRFHEATYLDNEKLIEISNYRHFLPKFLRKNYRVKIDPDSRIALIEFEFPDYSKQSISNGYKGKFDGQLKFMTATQTKKSIKQCLYSLIIRSAYLASKVRVNNIFDSVVVNVGQSWFDPATGQPRIGVIATLQAPVEYLNSLDLSKLDPEACFKYLKGISTPSFESVSPIRPIFTLNKDDERLVESKDVDSYIEPESNLAAMEWEDFEHLVAQLFEWEFSKNGIEVKVTRASRDRGVDAILFDPDPLKGGKYVIQAKRYTRTVDVSAVRDLYGTVMNEGANRGILITTASYGPDAYDFAKDKPISLVDGPNLLVMLQKHGKKFKIDLEEARRLNNEV
jgi:restriction system protein